jgi:hypothetical protein
MNRGRQLHQCRKLSSYAGRSPGFSYYNLLFRQIDLFNGPPRWLDPLDAATQTKMGANDWRFDCVVAQFAASGAGGIIGFGGKISQTELPSTDIVCLSLPVLQ